LIFCQAKQNPLCRVGPCESSRSRLTMRCEDFSYPIRTNRQTFSELNGKQKERLHERAELRTEVLPELRFDPPTQMFIWLDKTAVPTGCSPSANHLQGCPRPFLKPLSKSITMRMGCASLLEKLKDYYKPVYHEVHKKYRHECDKCSWMVGR